MSKLFWGVVFYSSDKNVTPVVVTTSWYEMGDGKSASRAALFDSRTEARKWCKELNDWWGDDPFDTGSKSNFKYRVARVRETIEIVDK